MAAAMNLVLIGYRGTGKSTVAQCLARELAWDWVDSDVEVELRAGQSIAAIFADKGQEAFRDLEQIVLAELMPRPKVAIAAGGGVVVRSHNRQLLRLCRHVVWLTARIDTIAERIAADRTTAARRPNLVGGGEAEIRQLLAERTPLYRQCATLEVATDELSPLEAASEICARLGLIRRGLERS
jgi:shikimate kinase